MVLGLFVFSDHLNLAGAHDVEAFVLTAVLLKNYLAGGETLDAEAAHQVFQLVLVDPLAQVEQLAH